MAGSAGPVYKYDLSLPVGEMYGLVEAMRERLQKHKDAIVVSYGHLNDGNLHLNVSVDSYRQEILDCIEPFVYEFTEKHRGSISAEHGRSLFLAAECHITGVRSALSFRTFR